MAIEDIGPTLIDLAWLGTYSLVAMAIWNFFMAAIGSDTEKTKEILKTDVGKTAKDYLPSIFGKEKTAEVKNQEHTAIVEDWKKKIEEATEKTDQLEANNEHMRKLRQAEDEVSKNHLKINNMVNEAFAGEMNTSDPTEKRRYLDFQKKMINKMIEDNLELEVHVEKAYAEQGSYQDVIKNLEGNMENIEIRIRQLRRETTGDEKAATDTAIRNIRKTERAIDEVEKSVEELKEDEKNEIRVIKAIQSKLLEYRNLLDLQINARGIGDKNEVQTLREKRKEVKEDEKVLIESLFRLNKKIGDNFSNNITPGLKYIEKLIDEGKTAEEVVEAAELRKYKELKQG